MKEPQELIIIDMMFGDANGVIERQEKRGQNALQRADVFPLDMQSPQADYERLGFVFGEHVDECFVAVTFPEGWSKRPTDHSMHTDVLDEHGRKRFGIFYKAAFYDRSAIAYSLNTRYRGAYLDHDYRNGESAWRVVDTATDETLQEWRHKSDDMTAAFKKQDEFRREAERWLDKNYPEWRDPFAYWENQ